MSEETKAVASETVSEQPTQESPTTSPDVGALIAESKKYSTRAQDAEARIAKMEKTLAKAEETKLKEKEDFKTLYEKVSSENESLSSVAEKWTKYEETRRASLLEKHPEEDRESLSGLDLETLEFVTNKITDVRPNAPELAGQARGESLNKPLSEMTEQERRQNWASIVKQYNK